MPKYIDISTKNIPPITYDRENNKTTVNSKLNSIGRIEADNGVILYDTPLLLNYDSGTKIQYDVALDGVSIQTYGGGKIGTYSGVSNVIGWNSNSATITGNFNVSGATTLTNGIITNSTTLSPLVLSYLSGATSNIQSQINSLVMTAGVSLASNNTFTGLNTFSLPLTLSGNLIAGSTTITNASLGCVSGATTNLQAQLNKITLSNLSSQTTGTLNFAISSSSSNGITTGSNNISMGYGVNNQLVSGSFNIGIGFQSSVGTGDENICIGKNSSTSGAFSASTAIGKNSSITASNQVVLGTAVDTVVILGSMNLSGASTLSSTLGVTGTTTLGTLTSGATTHTSTLAVTGATTLSSTLGVTGATTLGTLVCNQIYEITQATTGTTSPFTCNMALGSTFYIPTDYTFASNFQIIITNVPTDTTKTYTISVIYRQPTTLFYSSTARVSDTASTYLLGTASTYSAPLFNGGVPVLANSPNLIIQSFSIISTATSTNTFSRYITSSVNNHY